MRQPTRPDPAGKFRGTRPDLGGTRRDLTSEEIERMRPYAPAWLVRARRGVDRLSRTFTFHSFSEAMWFTLKVGELAELQRQRPTILTTWDHVTVALETPGANGIRREDFEAAAEIDRVYGESTSRRSRRSDA